MDLELSALEALFGYAPSISIIDRLVMADLVPIIDALQRQEPDPTLVPPSPEKIEKICYRKSPRHSSGSAVARPVSLRLFSAKGRSLT